MKKRILAVIAALFVAGATGAFATTGVGVQGGYIVGGSGAGALTFKLSNVPAVFAVNGAFSTNSIDVGLTADWWIGNPQISGAWRYFYGVGLAANVNLANDGNGYGYGGFGFGPRAVLGTNVFLINGFLELYAQVAYQPMFYLYANSNNAGLTANWVSFPINAGFRIWF